LLLDTGKPRKTCVEEADCVLRAVQVILWYYNVSGTSLKTGTGLVSDNSCELITPEDRRPGSERFEM
jgi:hypothetical protein